LWRKKGALQDEHDSSMPRVVSERRFERLCMDSKWVGMGLLLGVVVGVVADQLALWIPIGLALGVAAGAIQAKRKGNPKP